MVHVDEIFTYIDAFHHMVLKKRNSILRYMFVHSVYSQKFISYQWNLIIAKQSTAMYVEMGSGPLTTSTMRFFGIIVKGFRQLILFQ